MESPNFLGFSMVFHSFPNHFRAQVSSKVPSPGSPGSAPQDWLPQKNPPAEGMSHRSHVIMFFSHVLDFFFESVNPHVVLENFRRKKKSVAWVTIASQDEVNDRHRPEVRGWYSHGDEAVGWP